MSTLTTNLQLIKPDAIDPMSPIPFNQNADILDQSISDLTAKTDTIAGNLWNLLWTDNFDYTYQNTASYDSTSTVSTVTNINYNEYDQIMIVLENVWFDVIDISTNASGASADLYFNTGDNGGYNHGENTRVLDVSRTNSAASTQSRPVFFENPLPIIYECAEERVDINSLLEASKSRFYINNFGKLFKFAPYIPQLCVKVWEQSELLKCTGTFKIYGRNNSLPKP